MTARSAKAVRPGVLGMSPMATHDAPVRGKANAIAAKLISALSNGAQPRSSTHRPTTESHKGNNPHSQGHDE